MLKFVLPLERDWLGLAVSLFWRLPTPFPILGSLVVACASGGWVEFFGYVNKITFNDGYNPIWKN
ncbi:hypothetical protein EFBL_2952 [Effusibacillus lacus]|uniref:Uncharacterized protein n=1 Tax=Effusibacillus lacus TaxID=1348429 RepID=A0A292YQ20_9BACL|nr:hypothetical protein EFBL_2952 [Effusibacillus lacus]